MASTCRAHRVQVRGFSSLAATRAIVKPGFGSVALSQSNHGELWIRIPSRSLGGTGWLRIETREKDSLIYMHVGLHWGLSLVARKNDQTCLTASFPLR